MQYRELTPACRQKVSPWALITSVQLYCWYIDVLRIASAWPDDACACASSMFAREVDGEVFGSGALGDIVQWFSNCFSVTFHLLCCCRPAAAFSRRRTTSSAEYVDAPVAVASNMAQPGPNLERISSATTTSLMGWHAREGQALLKVLFA